MGQSHFGRDRRSFLEVIDYLVRLKIVVFDIAGFEGPLEIEAGRFGVFVMDPSPAFKSLSNILIATPDHENLGIRVHSVLLLPLFHVCDIKRHSLDHSLVALKEVIKSFRVHRRLRFRRGGALYPDFVFLVASSLF